MISFLLDEARKSLLAYKMRALLTALGLVIGVGAVVLLVAIGEGASVMITEEVESIGGNLFVVFAAPTREGVVRRQAGSLPSVTLEDAWAIEREVPGIRAVAPVVSGRGQLVYESRNWSTQVAGSTLGYFQASNWPLAWGSLFTERDVQRGARVVVLGRDVAREIFLDERQALGKAARINGKPFLVLGVLEAKGQSLGGANYDDIAIVPVTTARRELFGSDFPQSVDYLLVQGESPQVMESAEKEMKRLLRVRHRIKGQKEDDFTIRNLTRMAQVAKSTTENLSYLLAAIGSISLLVGGIGIMNIMLVSVTERTREIGVRMAVGAAARDILMQFLLEAALVSLGGAAAGLLLGVGAAWLVAAFTPMTVVVTGRTALVATLVSVAVGVFFGYYPAWRASRLNPIEALRTE